MENREFDQFAREFVGAPTRRNLVRGLAAILGTAGLGAGLIADAEAGKSKEKKRRERKKKQEKRKKKKQQCNGKGKVCATPSNPCQTVACENHKCVTRTKSDGQTCGNGEVCCSGSCVNLQTSDGNCSACGDSCGGGQTCDAGTCVCPENGTCIVTPNALGGWVIATQGVSFVSGPGTPPAGNGSVQIETTVIAKATLANPTFAGLAIADLETLEYSTYMQDGSTTGVVVPGVKLPVNTHLSCGGCASFTTLIYEPVYTAAPPVTASTWQSWDLFGANAKWWSSKDLPNGIVAFTSYVSWDAIQAAIPDATINASGLLLETGSGTPNAKGNVDELVVNGQRFDFQP